MRPSSRAISNARYSRYPESSIPLPLRDYHPLWCHVPVDFRFWLGMYPGLQLHISPWFPMGIRFALCGFRSPLLAASRLISFPLPTKMLQFGRFPLANASVRRQEVPLGHPRFIGSLRLPGAYRSLARPSSAPEPSDPSTAVATGSIFTSRSRMHPQYARPCLVRRGTLR